MAIPEVDTDTAAQHLEKGDALFMDVRDAGSFAAAHIPGAINVSDETIAAFLDQTDRNQKVIVYCYHGHNSLGGAAYLMNKGFKDVCSMRGGFESWREKHR